MMVGRIIEVLKKLPLIQVAKRERKYIEIGARETAEVLAKNAPKTKELLKKVPWARVAKEVAKEVALTAREKLVDDLLKNEDLTFQEKLEALEQMKKKGIISEEEYKMARQALMQTFPSHKL